MISNIIYILYFVFLFLDLFIFFLFNCEGDNLYIVNLTTNYNF